MSPGAAGSRRRGLERLLLSGGIVALAWCAQYEVRARLYQSAQARALEDRLRDRDPARPAIPVGVSLDPTFIAANDVAVLGPTRLPTLTLVTCYPFAWIGPAPRRYVVTARPATL